MKEDTKERTITSFIISFVVFISFVILYALQSDYYQSTRIHELLDYCQTITGQRNASFNNDGKFIGCEIVTK